MVWVACAGIVAWVTIGMIQMGVAGFYRRITEPPLYLVLASPFVLAFALTLAVTLVQRSREQSETRTAPDTRGQQRNGPVALPRHDVHRWFIGDHVARVEWTERRTRYVRFSILLVLMAALVSLRSDRIEWAIAGWVYIVCSPFLLPCRLTFWRCLIAAVVFGLLLGLYYFWFGVLVTMSSAEPIAQRTRVNECQFCFLVRHKSN
jgi:hypothetical protein